jgi:NTP pyrophosphatase (non-canonical NTP hydrolase)
MSPFQEQIKRFCEERGWNQFHNPKDLLLGIVEEVGEFRNLIKWEQDLNNIKNVINSHKEEVEDNIGDLFWFLALLANICNVDMDEAIRKVIKRNEERFPVAKTKNKHTNINIGGYDGNFEAK